jgi:hemolysin III
MKRIDHATIFVMIAGTYTPLCLLALGGATGTRMLALVWTGAALGLILAATGLAERPVLGVTAYIAFGWLAVIVLPALVRRLNAGEVALLVVGGVVYTAGAIVLALRWPNPSPRVFGYHEVWHVMVVAACVCHYLVILSVVAA